MTSGFFTHGVEFELPHPHIPERTILLICRVIECAWKLLENHPAENFDLKNSDEDSITEKLVWVIENRLRKNGEIPGFNTKIFGRVTRDSKVTNYNNNRLDKMPDMFFDLQRDGLKVLSTHDGIFVECKPIDKNHNLFSCYCQKGLHRFVNGDYAWAMQDALMIGYVKQHYSFPDLDSVLNENKSEFLNIIEKFHDIQNHIYISKHRRNFNWEIINNEMVNKKACPIKIYHCWQFHS